MQILFYWANGLEFVEKDKFQANMEEWLTSGHGPKQCHPGTVHAFCDETDALCHTIMGRFECERGHPFFRFVSSTNGRIVNRKP